MFSSSSSLSSATPTRAAHKSKPFSVHFDEPADNDYGVVTRQRRKVEPSVPPPPPPTAAAAAASAAISATGGSSIVGTGKENRHLHKPITSFSSLSLSEHKRMLLQQPPLSSATVTAAMTQQHQTPLNPTKQAPTGQQTRRHHQSQHSSHTAAAARTSRPTSTSTIGAAGRAMRGRPLNVIDRHPQAPNSFLMSPSPSPVSAAPPATPATATATAAATVATTDDEDLPFIVHYNNDTAAATPGTAGTTAAATTTAATPVFTAPDAVDRAVAVAVAARHHHNDSAHHGTVARHHHAHAHTAQMATEALKRKTKAKRLSILKSVNSKFAAAAAHAAAANAAAATAAAASSSDASSAGTTDASTAAPTTTAMMMTTTKPSPVVATPVRHHQYQTAPASVASTASSASSPSFGTPSSYPTPDVDWLASAPPTSAISAATAATSSAAAVGTAASSSRSPSSVERRARFRKLSLTMDFDDDTNINATIAKNDDDNTADGGTRADVSSDSSGVTDTPAPKKTATPRTAWTPGTIVLPSPSALLSHSPHSPALSTPSPSHDDDDDQDTQFSHPVGSGSGSGSGGQHSHPPPRHPVRSISPTMHTNTIVTPSSTTTSSSRAFLPVDEHTTTRDGDGDDEDGRRRAPSPFLSDLSSSSLSSSAATATLNSSVERAIMLRSSRKGSGGGMRRSGSGGGAHGKLLRSSAGFELFSQLGLGRLSIDGAPASAGGGGSGGNSARASQQSNGGGGRHHRNYSRHVMMSLDDDNSSSAEFGKSPSVFRQAGHHPTGLPSPSPLNLSALQRQDSTDSAFSFSPLPPTLDSFASGLGAPSPLNLSTNVTSSRSSWSKPSFAGASSPPINSALRSPTMSSTPKHHFGAASHGGVFSQTQVSPLLKAKSRSKMTRNNSLHDDKLLLAVRFHHKQMRSQRNELINGVSALQTSHCATDTSVDVAPSAAAPAFQLDFTNAVQMGEGNWFEVYRVQCAQTGRVFAVKKSKRSFKGKQDRSHYLHEVKLVSTLGAHPNIVKYYSAWQESLHFYVLMEYCSRGNLNDYAREVLYTSESEAAAREAAAVGSGGGNGSGPQLNEEGNLHRSGNVGSPNFCAETPRHRPKPSDTDIRRISRHGAEPFGRRLTDAFLWSCCYQVARGLQHVHDQNLLHLDIKPENILVSEHRLLKIGDFGQAAMKGQWQDGSEGDSQFMAPELLSEENGHTPQPSADIFSFGLLLVQLLTGAVLPQAGQTWHDLREGRGRQHFAGIVSDEFENLIASMLSPSPTERPSATDVLAVAARHLDPTMVASGTVCLPSRSESTMATRARTAK